MTRFLKAAVVVAAMMLLTTGCASKSYVVLMDNADGSVGKLAVGGPESEVLMDKPRSGIDLSGKAQKPYMVDEARIQKDFGAALAARPLLPVSYLLYFETGTTALTAESKALIPSILNAVKNYPAPDVSVIGHTDTMGDSRANEELALQRAQTVAEIIRNAGLKAHDLTVTSHGEKNPLIATPDNTDEPRNRRVEITVR